MILKALATIVVGALTTALAGPTKALEIPFSDTSGFSANAPRLASGGAPLAGRAAGGESSRRLFVSAFTSLRAMNEARDRLQRPIAEIALRNATKQ